ncbi:MAG: PAS domain S-box protein, partial [Rhabdaerophilum calidifontis]
DALRLADIVFESAAEAIVVTDADNNIVRVNPAFTTITGYTPAEVIGRNPRRLKSGRPGPDFDRDMWSDLDRLGHRPIGRRHMDALVAAADAAAAGLRDGDGPENGKGREKGGSAHGTPRWTGSVRAGSMVRLR